MMFGNASGCVQRKRKRPEATITASPPRAHGSIAAERPVSGINACQWFQRPPSNCPRKQFLCDPLWASPGFVDSVVTDVMSRLMLFAIAIRIVLD